MQSGRRKTNRAVSNVVASSTCAYLTPNLAGNVIHIRQALAGKFDTTQISNVLDYLSSEGHIYPTIDDDHYQLCSN